MELLLKKGDENLRQSILINNKIYSIFRDGVYLGEAIYLEDETEHGEGFFRILLDGTIEVLSADEWILL